MGDETLFRLDGKTMAVGWTWKAKRPSLTNIFWLT